MPDTQAVSKTSFWTDDFEELQDASADWDQQYFQMSPGPFAGGIERTQVGLRQIFREYWGQKIRYQGTGPPSSFAFALPFAQRGMAHWVGLPTCADSVIIQAPGQDADLVSSDVFDVLVLGVPEEEVRSIASALSGADSSGPEVHGTATLTPGAAARLRRYGREFLYLSASHAAADDTRIARHAQQLVRLFLWEILNTRDSREMPSNPAGRPQIVQKATELALADGNSTLGLTELCAGLGVSLRTLHYAFREVTGMPPATWLRRLRLNRIRKILLRSQPDSLLIKQVAIKHGFLHAGHFSDQYRRLFGCLPADTLQSAMGR